MQYSKVSMIKIYEQKFGLHRVFFLERVIDSPDEDLLMVDVSMSSTIVFLDRTLKALFNNVLTNLR